MVALSWAWSMVESRAFDVSLPGDGDSASAGVEVKEVDPKTRAKERMAAKKKQEAKERKELQKRVAAARRGVKPSKSKEKSKGKGKDKSNSTKADAGGLRRKGETMLQDNALVPLLDLANTPPPGWMPRPATPSDHFSQVGVDGESEPSREDAAAEVLQAVAGIALTVEADPPSVVWSDASTRPGDSAKATAPRSLVEAGYAGRGRDIAAKGMARAWVVLRVEPWGKAYGPVQGDGEATRDTGTVPVWLAYGGDPRLAEARLLRDTKGKKTNRRAPAAAALGTAGAASDAVSPSGELGVLLAGSRCAQEWWVHYGFISGGHSAASAAATPELRSAVEASEEATASLLREASRVAHAEKVRRRLQDAIAKADHRRSRRGRAAQRQAAGVSASATDSNETALAEALVLLDRHRRRVTRSSAEGVWSGAVHPPADCAAVRLRIKHDFNEEDIKSDAEPSMFTMSPHTALLRLTGLLPAMVRDGQPGEFKAPPNRDVVDVTAIVRAPPPQLLASLRTEVAKALWNDTGIIQAAAVAIAAGANAKASSLATCSNSTNSTAGSSSRALAAAISSRGGSAAPVMDLTSRITLPHRPIAPVPPGLLQAAAALATTREDIEDIGGPLAVASLLEIRVLDSHTAKRLGGKKQPRARKRGIRQAKSTRNAVEQQGKRGSSSELRAMRAAIEERGAIAVRGLMESTRDGAVAALRSLAQFPNALTPGAQGAVHDPGVIGLDRTPPPEASLGASVALRLAGFSIRPTSARDAADDGAGVEWPAGLGDDRGGLPPDLELLDPDLGAHSLTDAEALLPPDVRAVAHAHASALRALAAATEGAHVEADAAIEEFLAASETEYNPGRKR
jgi:hypothetical protein